MLKLFKYYQDMSLNVADWNDWNSQLSSKFLGMTETNLQTLLLARSESHSNSLESRIPSFDA